MTVVGVVPDYLQTEQISAPDAVAILPFRQDPRPWMSVLARTRVNAASLGNTFRREVQVIDPDLPVRDLLMLDDQLALSRWPLRVFGSMFTVFAGIPLLLATVGLYAVVAYGVSQRTQEIGVQVALGASAGSILRMVFTSGMRQAASGLALGLAASFGISRVITAILVGVSPTDPLTFGLVIGLLLAAATLGCTLPARRAIRVDPAVALRHE
jgi:putative ABC transport system permease protein